MSERRCLVTGVAGFIGSHIADRLVRDGFSVVGIDNESTGNRANVNSKVNYVRGDVRSPEELEQCFKNGVDVVVHLAGQASTIKSFENPTEDLGVNTVGTMNILQLCLKYKVPRLLFASSMTVYGYPEKVPTRETDPTQPISYYGITKYAAERYVHATAARNDLDFKFAVTSFRMFNVYGERQSLDNPYQGVLAIFISRAMEQKPIIIFGDGEQSRDFVYISDVVEAWVSSIDNPLAFDKTFNLGSGRRRSVNEVVGAVLKQFGLDRSSLPVNYQATRPGDQRHMEADITAAEAALGWEPHVSFEEGLKRTVQWARQSNRNLTSVSHLAGPS